MRKLFYLLCVMLLSISMSGTGKAVIIDSGPSNQYFYDTETDLYWIDPGEFQGMTKSAIDAWLTSNSGWGYATLSQMQTLYDHLSFNIDDWDAMGAPLNTFTDATGSHYYYDGWIVPYDNGAHIYEGAQLRYNDLTTSDSKGFKLIDVDVDGWGDRIEPGAWVVGSAVPEPTTMLLFGAGLVGLAGFGRKKFKK